MLREICVFCLPKSLLSLPTKLFATNAEWEGRLMRDFASILKSKDDTILDKEIPIVSRKQQIEERERCILYVLQLLLAMAMASDAAIDDFRESDGLKEAILEHSSFAFPQRTKLWIRRPLEFWKLLTKRKQHQENRSPLFIENSSVSGDIRGDVHGTANQLLAAMGHNKWVPKSPGQMVSCCACVPSFSSMESP